MKRLIATILVMCMFITSSPLVYGAEYILGPYDGLEVEIVNHPEFTAKTTIAPDGQICLPGYGVIYVKGKTLKQLHGLLTEKYKDKIKDFSVTINLIPRPIYVIQHDLKKNEWDVKTAKSIDEARAFLGQDSSPVKGEMSEGQRGLIEHGGIYTVNSGKQPDWWEDNWTKVISGTAVIVGIVNVTRKW